MFLLLCSSSIFAQNTITIKGKIIEDATKLPLESATIYITSVKDSTIIDYTISDKNGNFTLSTRKSNEPVYMKVSFIGFQEYSKTLESLSASKDFGVIYVLDQANDLNEVIVQGQAPPVRIKQDTLEFNASSFKVRPDSNVETLLKQLPGVAIDASGKITVNGKEVNNILVNGKPFFGKDGKVATKNLPSEIIDKVQISDTKTKEEELSGVAASSQEKTINLTIQKDKNKGLFGKFSAGKGSDDRYEASGLINYFKDDQKFSFLGSSNNINSVGFSMDEVFDAMGGGRNFYSNGDGSFGVDGMRFGSDSGITQSSMIGLNFADKWLKKLEAGGSYFFTNSLNNNENRSRIERFLPNTDASGNRSFITESNSKTRNINDSHNLNLEFEYKLDSLTTLSIRPKLTKNSSHSSSNSNRKSLNDLGLVNESTSADNSLDSNLNISNNLYLNRRFKKKGRNFGFSFNNSHRRNDSDKLTQSETNYFQDASLSKDIRNQNLLNQNDEDNFYTRIGYSEPITDSLSITFRTSYSWNDQIDNRNTFNFNPGNNDYSSKSDSLSYGISSKTTKLNPSIALNLRKKKFRLGIDLGTQIIKFDNTSNFLNNTTDTNRNYVFPSASVWTNYNISKSKSIYANYNFNVNLPSANRLLPIIDFSNPLNITSGNPDLQPEKKHNMYFNFNNYDYASKSGMYIYFGGNYNENEIVYSTVYDPNDLISRTKFENLNNTYSGYAGISYSKSIKQEQHTFRYGFELDGDYDYSKGLTNNQQYKSKGYVIKPSVELAWEYGELVTIAPSYRYEYNYTTFSNYTIDNSSNFRHVLKLETTTRWPKNVVIGNDFGYNYNSSISDGFQKDFYLWNSSLGYNFFGEKLLAKVKVYDLLNQNVNATRTITPTSIQDIENTVLKRYVMFSLTYKIEKFGGKKKNRWEDD